MEGQAPYISTTYIIQKHKQIEPEKFINYIQVEPPGQITQSTNLNKKIFFFLISKTNRGKV